ncbi:MAG: hypothetical protein H6721_10780 [Sandaracinus sp.]|nr:hypothetical protein [Sandaracinus sp.]
MRVHAFLGMCVLGVLALGCEPNLRNSRNQASLDFGCAKDQLDVRRRSRDTYLVTGCDRTGVYQCPEAPGVTQRFCVNLSLMARQRGEREFRCDLESVVVDELSPFVFRAEGCGHEAVYHCEASDGRPRCLLERTEDAHAVEATSVPSAPAPETPADPS